MTVFISYVFAIQPATGDTAEYTTAMIMKRNPTMIGLASMLDSKRCGSKKGMLKSIPIQVVRIIKLVNNTPGHKSNLKMFPLSMALSSIYKICGYRYHHGRRYTISRIEKLYVKLVTAIPCLVIIYKLCRFPTKPDCLREGEVR